MTHNDDNPVIFGWAASSNISFQGRDESGYTWGEWREMPNKEKEDAFTQFVWDYLGVEVYAETGKNE